VKICIYSSFWEKYSKRGDGFGDLKYQKPWHRIANWLTIRSYLKTIKNAPRVRALLLLTKKVCKEMNTHLTYDCFRQVCALAVILKHTHRLDRVLIIGDGFGFLACLIKRVFINCEIIFVDIPETLEIQKKYAWSEVKAKFYTSDQIDQIQGNFDLAINISSMQEMTKDMIRY